MEDPYRNRKNKPYEEMAEACKGLADEAEDTALFGKAVSWGILIVVGLIMLDVFILSL